MNYAFPESCCITKPYVLNRICCEPKLIFYAVYKLHRFATDNKRPKTKQRGMRSFFCNSAESCRKRVEIDLTRNFISVFSLIILVEIRGKYFYVNSTVRVQKGLHPACFINIFSPQANRPGCQQSGFRLARLYGATCIITNLFSL